MKKNVAWQALNSQHPVLRVKKEKKITAAEKGTWALVGAAGWVDGRSVVRGRKNRTRGMRRAENRPWAGAWRAGRDGRARCCRVARVLNNIQ